VNHENAGVSIEQLARATGSIDRNKKIERKVSSNEEEKTEVSRTTDAKKPDW